jgi:hypothetical protein
MPKHPNLSQFIDRYFDTADAAIKARLASEFLVFFDMLFEGFLDSAGFDSLTANMVESDSLGTVEQPAKPKPNP